MFFCCAVVRSGVTGSITVYSDYVCPFCYLGRQSLETYREARDDAAPALEIDWQPFDLRSRQRRPDGTLDESVDSGKDEAYYEEARQNVERLREEYGADEMSTDLVGDVDGFRAQVASLYVKETFPEQWLAFDEGVFAALWADDRDVGDADVLADIADGVGLDGEEIRTVVDDEAWRDRLRDEFADAREAGITGVPTFVYDGHGARGAVPPSQLERLVEGV
ncbi:thioredoxin domain protein [Halobacterium salinarum R1]|nr:thioredoxin domain protein [Halobacterium salinarum R1]